MTAAISAFPPTASADIVHLSNGQAVRGIVVERTAQNTRLQVAWQGYIALDNDDVLSIAPEPEEEHEALLAAWEAEHRARLSEHARRERDTAAEDTQRARQAENRDLLRELRAIKDTIREERRAHVSELADLKERLADLEKENADLRRQQWNRRVLIVPQGFYGQPHPHLSRHTAHAEGTIYQDEHGNLLRVREHEGHAYAVTPDGRHLDVTAHEGHLQYTDDTGAHHDLKPRR